MHNYDESKAYHMAHDDLPSSVPVFPISGVLLLPHGTLPLNIFEPRYLQLFDDALKNDRLIGMIQPRSDKALEKTGCVGRITDFHHMPDGRYMVSLYGLYRFDVIEELTVTTPYRKVKTGWDGYKDDVACDTVYNFEDRAGFESLLCKYFKSQDMQCNADKIQDTPCAHLITTLSMICPFSAQEKQMLLQAQTLSDRANVLMQLLEMATYESTGNQSTH